MTQFSFKSKYKTKQRKIEMKNREKKIVLSDSTLKQIKKKV